MKKKSLLILLLGLASLNPLWADEPAKETPTPYPLQTCIVSDEKLGEMGKPLYLQYKGQAYGFCCKPCTKDFREDPEKFRKKFEKEQKKTKK
ncbi:YHS domain-containing protein [Roseibacillus ishigakijimensis]|uniref:YHS domain-containing protein n=1 Tax=Roseibacillus ishigakijimensis TaxID=454146 RepID=A0A934VH39_9BACT|nr:YHS domain-containing protein [Roseibacillus ishigakijimensis]MBK1833538.1 hypothetical protein [Roseibacillus ishigakijimensis]